jgi:hypothetical protein
METGVCVRVGVLCFSFNSAFHHDNLLPQQHDPTTTDTLHPCIRRYQAASTHQHQYNVIFGSILADWPFGTFEKEG